MPSATRIRTPATLIAAARTLFVLSLLSLACGGTAQGQGGLFGGELFGGDGTDDYGYGDGMPGGAGLIGDPVRISAQFTTATVDRPAVLMVTADVAPGWHVYSISQGKTPDGAGPMATRITLDPSPSYKLLGSLAAYPPPEVHVENELPDWRGLAIEEHHEPVTWFVPIELAEGVDPASLAISGRIVTQACAQKCIPIREAFTANLGKGVPIGPLDFTQGSSLAADPPATTPAAAAAPPQAPPATGQAYDLSAVQLATTARSESLLWNLTIAFGGGLILNLMPCVLPVIGLKVMSFVDQAGKSRSHAFALNAWYSVGIISVFMVLAVLAIVAGQSWQVQGAQFGNATFRVTMASVIFVMALSLLGVWEIPIPGFLGSGKAQEAAAQEGALGAVLKGVVTTLLATPCIGPGMGAALGWAFKQPPAATLAVFASLGLGMASPYLLIGAFPSLVRFLPKPGAWMETFKQLMGFVLMATVLFLLSLLPSTDLLPTLVLFTCLAMACWAFSKTPATASASDLLQTYALSSAITVGGAVLSFGVIAPLLEDSGDDSWRAFSLAALQQTAVDEGKTVLVDFSADWCTNCKVLEKAVLHTEPVENAISRNRVVTMYADWTDTPPEITATLKALGSGGVPVIAIFPGGDPYRPIVFRDGYTTKGLLDAIQQAKRATGDAGGGVEKVANLPGQ